MLLNLFSKLIKPGGQIIYESSISWYNSRNMCSNIEKNSGLKLSTNKNKHKKIFGCSYCPERINPGDKKEQ